MSLSNLPPGVTVNDIDPSRTDLEHYLDGMSQMDYSALGLSDDPTNEQVLALEHIWEAAYSKGYHDGVRETKMGLNEDVQL